MDTLDLPWHKVIAAAVLVITPLPGVEGNLWTSLVGTADRKIWASLPLCLVVDL